MASLTVRQLDDKLKKLLRLRAARHGRSMEDEVRTILRQAAQDTGRERAGDDQPASAVHATAPHARDACCRAKAPMRHRHRVLLIIGGGIAAYKSLDLIRRLQDKGTTVRCILTKAAQEFITPLAAGALSGGQAFTDLFDPQSEFDVGHIRLARDTELVVVAPATADLMAKMAGGHADDLATAVLLATDKPILIAPAMNPAMWARRATQRNLARLIEDGVACDRAEHRRDGGARRSRHRPHGGAAGDCGGGRNVACGRCQVSGRWPASASSSHRGRRTSRSIRCVTSPTARRANRATPSQQQQQQQAPRSCWCRGRSTCRIPQACKTVHVETAREMLAAVEKAMPADCAIFAAAVADWRVGETNREKIKKAKGRTPSLSLVENPDILATIAQRKSAAAGSRHRLRSRDREPRRQRQREAQAQRLRLDRRQ